MSSFTSGFSSTFSTGRCGEASACTCSGPGGIGTGYGHLSRVLVRNGERVPRGQVVAYSGNSGLSTGPHLHFEVYRGGNVVNPRGLSFSSVASLTGSALRAFRSHVADLLAVRPGKPGAATKTASITKK